ncbi:MAG: hypothetical protein HQL20_01495 [Candidatus Omnitrophica bacterium]|nr:hypothetical protein [Candidatus Omnitrophota bacterium]
MRADALKLKNFAICWAVLIIAGCVNLSLASAAVIINVLAVNGTETAQDKDIRFSLPGEIKPSDIVDPAGLEVDYDIKDAGYFLHGKCLLQPKESRTFKVKIRDVWRISNEKIADIRQNIEQGFNEMGAERSAENGQQLKEKLIAKLDYVLSEQSQATGSIDQRIDTYRSHLQTLEDINTKAKYIDYWRSDAQDQESKKIINYVLEVSNPTDKLKKVKQQHFLPLEVRPEDVVDRQGYEIRFDENKQAPFLFKEEDLGANEKKNIRIGIRDVWFVPQKDIDFIKERSTNVYASLQASEFSGTAKTLFNEITNNLELISSLQAMQQPDIQQHIGAFRINQKRLAQTRSDCVALEKLLAQHRAKLEKSKIKNVMQKIQSMKSLARVSQAIFDKKPTVNAAWKIIGSVMIFLALFTFIHFITWFLRTAKEKKQEEMTMPKEEKKDDA